MRVLITGATGMLGSALVPLLSDKHEVFGTGTSKLKNGIKNYMSFDLLNDDYSELIAWSDPNVIIHGAAITDGGYCAKNPEEAFKVNGFSVKKLVEASSEDVQLIYISTDAVFANDSHMSKEQDCVAPESVYGKSKELGEFFLLNSERDFTIIRTTIVGLNMFEKKMSFVEWIINSAQKGIEINLFDDVLFNPISIWELSSEIDKLLLKKRVSSKILHISGKEPCSKFSFGMSLLQGLNLPTHNVNKSSIQQFKGRLNRSSDQTLDCSFYEKNNEISLPQIKETIVSIKSRYNASN